MLGPFFKRFAPSAMDQNNRGKSTTSVTGSAKIGEDPGRLLLKWLPLIIDFLNGSSF